MKRLSKKMLLSVKEKSNEEAKKILKEFASGKAEIEVELKAETEIIQPFSNSTHTLLHRDLMDYLCAEIYNFPIRAWPTVSIILDKNYSEEQKCLLQSALNRSVDKEVKDLNLQIKRLQTKAIWCWILALIIFAFVITLYSVGGESIWYESISVIAWVFMWEGTELLAFEKREHLWKIWTLLKLKYADFEYKIKD